MFSLTKITIFQHEALVLVNERFLDLNPSAPLRFHNRLDSASFKRQTKALYFAHICRLYEAAYSLILITILDMIAANPPVVMPEEKIFLIVSGNCISTSG